MKAKTTPIIQINHPLFIEKGIKVWVKLDYKRHPEVQGNKWHKLKLNVKQAQKLNKNTLLTFGGAYSNHIASTAAMAKLLNMKSIGVIRGNELNGRPENWSHTLLKAHQQGMQFDFISRKDYRYKDNSDFLQSLINKHPNAYVIPEGGSNELAVDGFEDFMTEVNQQLPNWSHIFTAVGTGGTLAGMTKYACSGLNAPDSINANTSSAPDKQDISKTQQSLHKHVDIKNINGVTVLKDADFLTTNIEKWIGQPITSNTQPKVGWSLLTEYHHGGYAKQSDELNGFIAWFEETYRIPTDPVYTSKMFYAFFQEVKQNRIAPKSTVLLIHTGGLQGRKNNSN